MEIKSTRMVISLRSQQRLCVMNSDQSLRISVEYFWNLQIQDVGMEAWGASELTTKFET